MIIFEYYKMLSELLRNAIDAFTLICIQIKLLKWNFKHKSEI